MKVYISNNLWGKKKNKINGEQYWLPLKQHLIDTKNVALLLWEHWLDESQKNIVKNAINNTDEKVAKKLVGFLANVHDIGKATPAFQIKESIPYCKEIDDALKEKLKREKIDIDSYILSDPNKSHHALAGQVILEKYGVDVSISSIIGSHHGKPVDTSNEIENQLYAYEANYYSTRKEDSAFWEDQQKSIINWALNENRFNNIEDLPKINQIGQIILTGLVIIADWIASNDEYFPLINISEDLVDNTNRKENGWRKWFKTYIWEPDNKIDDVQGIYDSYFGFDPNVIQKKLFDIISNIEKPGIVVIEAPMGIGKTEMALVAVEQLANKCNKSGMFFGLPTQATSNGIFTRVKDWLDKVCEGKDEIEKHSIKLMHGKAELNEEYTKIKQSTYNDTKDVIVNEWFSGRKKSMLDEFVVGTVDQFLLASLKQKHFMLRHLGFSKKVVIIDEVHSYDMYMTEYLKRTLNWMGVYNIPVILLSATLPVEIKKKLIEGYLKPIYKKEIDIKYNKNLNYPVITYSDANKVYQFSDFKLEKSKIVKIEKSDLEASEILENILKNSDGVVGIIVDTVKKAQEIARKCLDIYKLDEVELLHSNFIAIDRIKKEEKLLECIGKNKKRPKRKIIIGTQVIEQSLDIDFDVLISEIAPIDLLLQRIGRLHRHEKKERPTEFKIPKCYVIGTNENYEFDKGTKSVYDEYILTKTQYYLPDEIQIPNDIPILISKVYGEDDKKMDISKDMQKLKGKFDKNKSEKINKAKTFLLDKPKKKGNILGMLYLSQGELSEEQSYAQVRDINYTIEVIAVKKFENGYSIFKNSEDISNKLEKYSKELLKNTVRLPQVLTINSKKIDATIKCLEEYNNKYLKEWQKINWLKGKLGIIFDENNEFKINNIILVYDNFYGLYYRKIEGDDDDKI